MLGNSFYKKYAYWSQNHKSKFISTTKDGLSSVSNIILYDDFNVSTQSFWKIDATGSIGTVYPWIIQTSSSADIVDKFVTPDATNFMIADPDKSGSSTTLNTRLTSPNFSLINYNSAQISFNHAYAADNTFTSSGIGDINVTLEISKNNWGTWSVIQNFTNTTIGTSQAFQYATFSLNSYLGLSDLSIRFNYISHWGYWWAINRLLITGSPSNATSVPVTIGPTGYAIATIGKSYGKWYWEITNNSYSGLGQFGISTYIPNNNDTYNLGSFTNSILFYANGTGSVFNRNGVITTATVSINSFSYSDVFGLALDLNKTSPNISIYKNGTISVSNIYIGTYSLTWYPAIPITNNYTNFGQHAFSYSVPSGFSSGLFNPYYTKLDISKSITNANSYVTNNKLTYNVGQYTSYAMSKVGKSSGKWYCEIHVPSGSSSPSAVTATYSVAIGVANTSHIGFSGALGQDINSWALVTYYTIFTSGFGVSGFVYHNNIISGGSSFAYGINDYIGLALDMDAGTLTMIGNGSVSGVMFTGLTGTLYPIVGAYYPTGTVSYDINFGATAFKYDPPAGYNYGFYE